ncbi:MAG: hypothetical protein AB1540_06515 [Bdellovibrionota bacterium]
MGYIAGALAAFLISLLAALGRNILLVNFDLEMILGSFVTNTIGEGTWVLGFSVSLMAGSFCGLFYALGFKTLRKSGTKAGLAFGLVHWTLTGLIFGILSAHHPLSKAQPHLMPGFFGLDYGFGLAGFLLFSHLFFGALVGKMQTLRSRRLRTRRPPRLDSSEQKVA